MVKDIGQAYAFKATAQFMRFAKPMATITGAGYTLKYLKKLKI